MGTKTGKHNKPSFSGFYIEDNQGCVAQLLHPCWVSRNVAQVTPFLKEINNTLSKEIKLVLSGGGLIEITKSSREIKVEDWNSEKTLKTLVMLVQEELQPISTLTNKFNRDYIIGVDVIIEDSGESYGVGQFAVVFSRGLQLIAWKSYPVDDEGSWLAGFGTAIGRNSPRIVSTSLGKGIVLVCHDSQAYNHRNRANVRKALRKTPRRLVMDKMDKEMSVHKPQWGFNLIHWIGAPKNLRTFSTSYKQIAQDNLWNPKIIGAFGYDRGVKKDLEELAKRAKYPQENGVVIVLEAAK